jgi:hypothetical protein
MQVYIYSLYKLYIYTCMLIFKYLINQLLDNYQIYIPHDN